MERLTKVISCPDGTRIYDISNKIFGLNTSRADKTRMILEKLAVYEDLEELIGIPLKELAKIFRQHIPDGCQHPQKAIVLTDGDVDKWREYKAFKKDGRLIKLPCKVGDTLYRVNKGAKEPVIMMRVLQLHIKQLHKDRTAIKIIAINDDDMGESCYFLEDIGETVFLTKSEAEAKLEELRGKQNEREEDK